MHVRTAGVQFMRDNPERFIGSNTENSWLRYLNNMCIQGTWADAVIIQAVADALNVTIQIVDSNQGQFAPLTTVYPVQERNTSLSSNHALTGILQHYRLPMNMHVCSMRSVMQTV